MLRLASRNIGPKKNALTALVGAATLGVALTGCDPIDLDQRTRGEEGTLAFSYAGKGFLDCLFGCGIDRPLMTHSDVTIVIGDADPAWVLSARTTAPSAAVVTMEEHLSCVAEDPDGTTHDRDVTRDEPCAANEERHVVWVAEIAASKPGAFDLEIVDDAGDLVDSLPLEARDATRAELRTGAGDAAPLTALHVAVGETKVMTATYFDGSSQELASGITGDAWSFSDPSVAKAGSPLNLLLGPWDGIVVEGAAKGATSIDLHIDGLDVSLPIIVE